MVAEAKKESTFEKALRLWGETRLPDLQAQLEDQSSSIQDLQARSIESRKHLASKTKEFKKLDDNKKLAEFKVLLKQYQTEIDSLTTRSKLSENGFFQVYRTIGELPDPKPLLEASLDSVIAAQEVQELRTKNSTLQNDLLKYADYEQLKSRLLRSEQKSIDTLNNRLRLKEEELKAVFEEKEQNWQTKEESLQNKIEDLEHYVKELVTQQKIDKLKLKNQRIALGGTDEDEEEDEDELEIPDKNLVSSKEVEILKKESEYRLQRANQLEKRNEELTREVKIAKSDATAQEIKIAQELKLNDLESENVTLVAQLDNQKVQLDSNTRSSTIQISSLKRQIENLSSEVESFKSKLIKYKDYDDIKQELTTLRAISFGQDEENDTDEEEQDNVKTTTTQLDEILVSRNKKLTSEIVDLRLQNEQLRSQIKEIETALSSSKTEVQSLSELTNQLESDLTHLQNTSSKFDNLSMISGVTRNTTANRGGRRLSPASSIAGGQIPETIFENDSSASVLPIITSQRDRFRSRNIELESQLKKQSNQISELRSEIKKLKKDNSELFEKTRYLSSFQGSVQRNNQSSNHLNNDPEKQYESTYEESLHPLARFRQREQERAASRLSTLERIFLSFAKAILANKASRMLFLGYCVGLHFLVMAMSVYVMGLHGISAPDVGADGVGNVQRATTNIIT